MNKSTTIWSHTENTPAEVVISQSKTASVYFSSCEPLSSQGRGVPVDALCSWLAEAPRATVAFTLPRNTLLIIVCGRKRQRAWM